MPQRKKSGMTFRFPGGYFHTRGIILGPELFEVGWHNESAPCPEKTAPPCHWLYWMEWGEGTLETVSGAFPLKAGELAFVPQGESPRFQKTSDVPCRCYYAGVGTDRIGSGKEQADLTRFLARQTTVTIAQSEKGGDVFTAIIAELWEKTSLSLLRQLFLRLLILSVRCVSPRPVQRQCSPMGTQAVGQTAYAVIRYMDEHLEMPGLLPNMARELGYHYQYLSHLFRRKTGLTIRTYLTRKRMERARLLLMEETITITEIARRLQYQSLQSFSRAFKRETGFSPAHYRRYAQKEGKGKHE